MAKRSGRKVYRNSANAKKKKAKKVLGVFVTILGLIVLGFIGYSIAKPIFNYFNSESENLEQVIPWTPPVLPDEDTEEKKPEDDKIVQE